jgi:transposase-like protein
MGVKFEKRPPQVFKTPLHEEAVRLYVSGQTLRDVAAAVGRSHEWVRRAIRDSGELPREIGRPTAMKPRCIVCYKPCSKSTANFCSRVCVKKHRHELSVVRLKKAMAALKAGKTYREAAKIAGIKTAWELWGRLFRAGYLKPSSDSPSE